MQSDRATRALGLECTYLPQGCRCGLRQCAGVETYPFSTQQSRGAPDRVRAFANA